MDGQIRLRRPDELVAQQQPKARRTISLPGTPAATITSLRRAVLDCAAQATAAEPIDTDRRLHSFIAKLSGTMEGLGERELDAVLWNLMSSPPAASKESA